MIPQSNHSGFWICRGSKNALKWKTMCMELHTGQMNAGNGIMDFILSCHLSWLKGT